MDTSPLQSTPKCGSDFSIARILSSDKTPHPVSRSEDREVPDWLCCTRYRPPRLPRAMNIVGCRARRSGRHARVPFTASQAAALEAAYARSPYLAPPALRALAAALQLRDDRIKIWFQNRRARERREKCVTVTPPTAVTLPSTANASWMSPNCPWTMTREETHCQPCQSFNFNVPVVDTESTNRDTNAFYERDTNLSETSFSDSTDEDQSELPLDIETIED